MALEKYKENKVSGKTSVSASKTKATETKKVKKEAPKEERPTPVTRVNPARRHKNANFRDRRN